MKTTKIQCLNCKKKFDVADGQELLVSCPACSSQDLRWIIGSFQDYTTIREVRVKRLIKDYGEEEEEEIIGTKSIRRKKRENEHKRQYRGISS